MDSQGIIFELQWKKKQGVANREEDIANLGIWDTADSASSLNWMTFQSYLCQNLGTRDAISVAYVDSEGDELPIESECEFQEALKFARQRARRSRKIVLKVDKKDVSGPSVKVNSEEKGNFVKLPKSGNAHKVAVEDKMTSIKDQFKSFRQAVTSELKDLQKSNRLLTEKLESMTKQEEQDKSKIEDETPLWFKRYMQKMKRQIVEEVNASTWQIVSSMSASRFPLAVKPEVASPQKKRSSDEDSSDAALGSDQRDHKLLRKIEKLHKREKKLEKKFDTKLEKLESKTKRMMEKKSQSKCRAEWEKISEKKSTRKRLNDGNVGTNLMDAILLNDGLRSETRIKLGKRFTKIWEIMNNGSLPWTDKTELRLAWGTLGLEPEEAVVKCPLLEPGEKGQIAVNFRAPDFPGTFEVYWHFYHMGMRFGHWIGCAVVVEEEVLNICCSSADVGTATGNRCFKEALSKPTLEKEEEQGNFEKLDNVESLKSESAANIVQRCEDPSTSQNLNNIQIESNVHNDDVPVDLTNKSNVDSGICNPLPAHPNNNNINAASRAEYDSDSDDDNLSIISGAACCRGGTSSSSDSGDEQFVMVPMPACFMRDVPLGSAPVPVAAAILKEDTPAPSPIPAPAPAADCEGQRTGEEPGADVNTAPGEESSAFAGDQDDDCEYSSTTSHDAGEHWWDSEDFKSNVYAVDAGGTCVPLETAWPINEATKIRLGYAAKGCSLPKGCSSPKQGQSERKSQQKTHHHPSATVKTEFQTSAFLNGQPLFVHSHNYYGKDDENTSESNQRRSQSYEFNSTLPPRDCFNGAYNMGPTAPRPSGAAPQPPKCATPPQSKGTAPPQATEHTSSHSHTKSHSTSFSSSSSSSSSGHDGSVHILPETIVNGAINVANSAYSTARALISNLGASGLERKGKTARQGGAGMTTSECLKLLVDMGFRNHNLNVLLLQRYDNDVAKVVAELLRGSSQAGCQPPMQ